MTEKILCVDDEEKVLEGLQRHLRKQFVVETAASGSAGLALLAHHGPFAVVVSDMRMPSMNGVQFLTLVRQQAPTCVRILLTGQTDLEAAVAAVNEGGIFRFLTKPCPPDSLVRTLQDALDQYRLVMMERTLLEHTLHGSVQVLTDVLALSNPVAFGRASRLKRYVQHIATHLGLPEVWQYELAALLSPIGCVALPMETLEKVYAGQPLLAAEQQMFAAHPTVGSQLLRHIPRLETVAAIIARQHDADVPPEAPPEGSPEHTVLVGAQVLKVALAFDQRLRCGMSAHQALAEMLQQAACYEHRFVTPLQTLDRGGTEPVRRVVRVRDLCPGMVLDEDIYTKTGNLVLAKGHEVSFTLIERLRSYGQRVGVVEPFRVLVQV